MYWKGVTKLKLIKQVMLVCLGLFALVDGKLALADAEFTAMRDEMIATDKHYLDDKLLERQSQSRDTFNKHIVQIDQLCSLVSDDKFKPDVTKGNKSFWKEMNFQFDEIKNNESSSFDLMDKKADNSIDTYVKYRDANCEGLTWESGSEILYLCHVKVPAKIGSLYDIKLANIKLHKIHQLEFDFVSRYAECASKLGKKYASDGMALFLQLIKDLDENDAKWSSGFYEIVSTR